MNDTDPITRREFEDMSSKVSEIYDRIVGTNGVPGLTQRVYNLEGKDAVRTKIEWIAASTMIIAVVGGIIAFVIRGGLANLASQFN